MTIAHPARQTARRIGDSRALAWLTRIGFIGYGLFHLAIAWLAVQIALGHPTGSGDQTGAFGLLARQPAGKALLIVVVVGLAAMALWQLMLVIVGRQAGERVQSAGRVIVYGFLCWTGSEVIAGDAKPSNQQQKDVTIGLMRHAAGRWLVGIASLAVIGIAIGMIVYGARRSFRKKLKLAEMSAHTRSVVTRLGQIGYMSKGLALGIVGALVFDVALVNRPDKSSGLDAALHSLTKLTFGTVLLLIVALGFAAHGLYCFCQSKYRKV
jgi:hypothetical protein